MKDKIHIGHIYYDKKAKQYVFVTKVIYGKYTEYSDVDYYFLLTPDIIRTTPYDICKSNFQEVK